MKRRGCEMHYRGCSFRGGMKVKSVEKYDDLHGLSVSEVEERLNLTTPWVVGIPSGGLKNYEGGIARVRGSADHAVLLVGKGYFNGEPVWLCRNSWGDKFGYNGYFLLPHGVIHYACRAKF